MKINTSRRAGFTLVEIMIVVAIIGLLAAIAIPNFVRARQTAQANACINNLRQIDGAIQQWALENNQPASATVTSGDLTIYLGRGSAGTALNDANGTVRCPGGGNYTVSSVNEKPVCSLSASSTPVHELK